MHCVASIASLHWFIECEMSYPSDKIHLHES